MMTIDREQEIVETAYKLFLDLNINNLEIKVFDICNKLNIKLIGLSQLIDKGFSKDEIFYVWKNKDGASTVT